MTQPSQGSQGAPGEHPGHAQWFGQQPGYPPPAYGPPPGYGHGYGYGYHPGYAAAAAQVPKPTGWFVVNWIFLWPLALYSLLSAWQNIDRALYAGDVGEAQRQAARVKKFGIIGLVVGIAWVVLWIVYAIVLITKFHHDFRSCNAETC